MKKIGAIWLAINILFLLCISTVFASDMEPDQNNSKEQAANVEFGCYSLDGKVPVMGSQKIIPNMDAAFLYDVDNETVLYAVNPDTPMYPASLVKIVTALIAVEKGNLSDAVTVKENVLSTVPKSAVTAHLLPNEIITLENALYCMMVGSANDAAAVIADHISGSQEAFVAEMNRLALDLGCTGTNFTNCHGLHDSNQVTTARDMAKIVCYAIQNPAFFEIYSTIYYDFPATNLSESREFTSNNYLMSSMDNQRLYNDSRVTGGRTGTTEDGKRSLAISAADNGRTLISIIMGSANTYNEEDQSIITFGGFPETSDLLTMGFENYEPRQVLHEGQIFKQCAVQNGENEVVVGSSESAVSVLPVSISASDLTYRYFDVEDAFVAPVEIGEKLSHVQIWYGNVCVAQTDLYAMSEVHTAVVNPGVDQTAEENRSFGNALVYIAAVAVGVIAVLFCIRLVGRLRLAAIKRRGRRYRKSRRRSR